jgi:hypothetical protein
LEFGKFLVMLPVTVLQQFGQIASGLWKYIREDAELSTFIPEWVLRLTVHAIPKAIAGETPQDQIEGSIILIGWSIATSLFTGGTTAVFVLFWGFFLFWGTARFSDWGEAAWSRGTSVSMPGKDSAGRYRTRGRE